MEPLLCIRFVTDRNIVMWHVALLLKKLIMGYVYWKSLRTSLLESFNILYGLLLSLGGKVSMNDLYSILSNLGIKRTDTELKDPTQNIHVGGKHVIRYNGYPGGSRVKSTFQYIWGKKCPFQRKNGRPEDSIVVTRHVCDQNIPTVIWVYEHSVKKAETKTLFFVMCDLYALYKCRGES